MLENSRRLILMLCRLTVLRGGRVIQASRLFMVTVTVMRPENPQLSASRQRTTPPAACLCLSPGLVPYRYSIRRYRNCKVAAKPQIPLASCFPFPIRPHSVGRSQSGTRSFHRASCSWSRIMTCRRVLRSWNGRHIARWRDEQHCKSRCELRCIAFRYSQQLLAFLRESHRKAKGREGEDF